MYPSLDESVDEPLISCIVPVYNGERFLAEALQSILDQTYQSLEVLVVDDGSTDGSAEVVDRFAGRVTCIHQTNGGPASARNTGVRAAAGAYLAFLDADDLWHAEKLQRQLARFRQRPDLELSLTYKRTFWVEAMRHEQQRLLDQGHPFADDHPGYVCQTMLMPRSTYDRVGPFNEDLRIGEDTDWILRAERLGVEREILRDVLVFRRMHENNISYSRYDGGAQDQLKMLFSHIRSRRAAAPGESE